jgi:DNA polymerase III subunit alpha
VSFAHLHLHTEYSLADSSLKVKELAKAIKNLGMNAVAMTDHGNLHGVIPFYKACKKEGVKPIIGCEVYIAPRGNRYKDNNAMDNANYHLVLLAENNEGYQNLMQICSDAALEGFYYKPRTDLMRLREFGKGLIALSACLGGQVQKYMKERGYQEAKEIALRYDEVFGRGNFYLELQDHGLEEQKEMNRHIIRLSRETGIPLICTNDCHFMTKEDWEAHDVLMAIQAKVPITDREHRKVYDSDQFYLKTPEEMFSLFSYVPDALENTVRIAQRCNVEFEFGKNKLPPFDVPEGWTANDYLMDLIMSGAKYRYGELSQDVIDRINYEFGVVDRMGYINYFLITWDIFRFCQERKILTGPGRGSAAGSIMSYCLGITQIEPLCNGLMFERFLDPSRVSPPDIDSDFQYDRRQEVIDYIIGKYDRESVCQIVTFGTMAARSAIRAVGRALGYAYAMQDKVAKMVPMEIGITLAEALEMNPDLKEVYNQNPDVKRLVDISMKLEGLPLYTGTHAAGVLITDRMGVTAHVPVCKTDKGIVAQFPMNVLEDLGLDKSSPSKSGRIAGKPLEPIKLQRKDETSLSVNAA